MSSTYVIGYLIFGFFAFLPSLFNRKKPIAEQYSVWTATKIAKAEYRDKSIIWAMKTSLVPVLLLYYEALQTVTDMKSLNKQLLRI